MKPFLSISPTLTSQPLLTLKCISLLWETYKYYDALNFIEGQKIHQKFLGPQFHSSNNLVTPTPIELSNAESSWGQFLLFWANLSWTSITIVLTFCLLQVCYLEIDFDEDEENGWTV